MAHLRLTIRLFALKFCAFLYPALLATGGCRDEPTVGSKGDIDCRALTEDDVAYYYAKDFGCIDAEFCEPEGVWEQCIEDTVPSIVVTGFSVSDDSWTREIACRCVESWE